MTTTQWELLGDLVKILHPLEIGTTYLSEETSSLSSVFPVLFGIIKNLEVEENDSTSIIRFKISVDSQIGSRWHFDNIDSSDIRLLAAALDPRHKALKFLSAEKTSEVKAELRDQIQQLQIDNDTLNSN